MVVNDYILVLSAFEQKAVRNCAKLCKAELFVKVTGRKICFYNRIELQDFKSVFLSLNKAVHNKLFAYMTVSCSAFYGVACIADMTAPADIVGVKNIQTENFVAFTAFGNCAISLRAKKLCTAVAVEQIKLRESYAVINNLVPYFNHCRVISRIGFANIYIHKIIPF